jgi:hypothetical protein
MTPAKILTTLVGAVMPTEHFPPEPFIAQAVAVVNHVPSPPIPKMGKRL